MTPIISPWLFYLIGIGSKIVTFFGWVGGICLLIGAGFFIMKCITDGDESYKDVFWIKWKSWILIGLACCLMAVFIPSKETCYQMMVASMITSDNIEITKNSAKGLVDYIVDKIDELNDGDKKDD